MQTIGATQLNFFYFIKSTMLDGKISNRIASWIFWKILILVYYTAVVFAFKQTAIFHNKALHYFIYVVTLFINQIFLVTAVELIIRSQKIYLYLPQSRKVFFNSIIINCVVVLLANIVICCMLPLHFNISVHEVILLSFIQLFLSLPAALISVMLCGILLAFLKKSSNASSKRSSLILGNNQSPANNLLATKFLVWRRKWIDFSVIFSLSFIFIAGIIANIYFKSPQFIVIALAIDFLLLQSYVYQLSISDLTEKLALKTPPFRTILFDFIRLSIWQVALVIAATIIAFLKGWEFFPTTIIFIITSAYLLFAAMLYHNRFGKNLSMVAMTGEVLVLGFTAVALLPLMPLFAAFFMYQNFKNQPKGFYGLS